MGEVDHCSHMFVLNTANETPLSKADNVIVLQHVGTSVQPIPIEFCPVARFNVFNPESSISKCIFVCLQDMVAAVKMPLLLL